MYRAGLTAQGCWDEMDDYDQEAILKLVDLVIKECYNVVISRPNIGTSLAGHYMLEHFKDKEK